MCRCPYSENKKRENKIDTKPLSCVRTLADILSVQWRRRSTNWTTKLSTGSGTHRRLGRKGPALSSRLYSKNKNGKDNISLTSVYWYGWWARREWVVLQGTCSQRWAFSSAISGRRRSADPFQINTMDALLMDLRWLWRPSAVQTRRYRRCGGPWPWTSLLRCVEITVPVQHTTVLYYAPSCHNPVWSDLVFQLKP